MVITSASFEMEMHFDVTTSASTSTNCFFTEEIEHGEFWNFAFGCKDLDDYHDLIQRLRLQDYRKDLYSASMSNINVNSYAQHNFNKRKPVNRDWRGKQVRSR